jgi:mannose/fructose/N-acetylgalactosamine-specific phosphotransferase system component IIB
MRLAVPPEVDFVALSVADAAKVLASSQWKDERVVLLLPGLREARLLAEAGWIPPSLNLGGLHDAPGRVSYTPSLSLGVEDKEDLRFLIARKIPIDTRALPSDDNVPVEKYLGS